MTKTQSPTLKIFYAGKEKKINIVLDRSEYSFPNINTIVAKATAKLSGKLNKKQNGFEIVSHEIQSKDGDELLDIFTDAFEKTDSRYVFEKKKGNKITFKVN